MWCVEPAVDQRDDREKVFGIVFLHRPVDARRVSRRIAAHSKSAANEVCESSLLAPLALILKIVDRQHREPPASPASADHASKAACSARAKSSFRYGLVSSRAAAVSRLELTLASENPDVRTTRMCGHRPAAARASSRPESSPGMTRSVKSKSTRSRSISAKAAAEFSASSTLYPSSRACRATIRRRAALSSTARMTSPWPSGTASAAGRLAASTPASSRGRSGLSEVAARRFRSPCRLPRIRHR
jgi:hypothetical protein